MSALFAEDECGPRVDVAKPAAPQPSRQDQIRAADKHPASARPLLPAEDGRTCGGCTFRKQLAGGSTVAYRCVLSLPPGRPPGRAMHDDPACVAWRAPLQELTA